MVFRNFLSFAIAALSLVSSTKMAWAEQKWPNATFAGTVKARSIDPSKAGKYDGDTPRFLIPDNRVHRSDLVMAEGQSEFEPSLDSILPQSPEEGIQGQTTHFAFQVNSIGPNGFSPPDPTCAGGTNHLVVATNDDFAIYDRVGNLQHQYDINAFLNDNRDFFNPHLIWDVNSDRFMMSWNVTSAAGVYSESWTNHLVVMVSKSSNPNDGWWLYEFNVEDDPIGVLGNRHRMATPKIGVQRDAITASGRYVSWTGIVGAGTWDRYYTFHKGPMLAGQPTNAYYFTDLFTDGTSTVDSVPLLHQTQRLSTVDSTQAMAYFMAAKPVSSDKLWLLRMRVRASDGFPTVESYDPITVGTYLEAPGMSQIAGAADLDNPSPRLMNGVYSDHNFYTTHAVEVNTYAGIKTYKIGNSAGYPVIWDEAVAGSNLYFGNPAVAVDSLGRAALARTYTSNFGTSGFVPSAVVSFRLESDAAWSPFIFNTIGNGTYEVLINGQNRWGETSGASLDVWDENSFYVFGQATGGANNWKTGLARISFKDFYDVGIGNFSIEPGGTVTLWGAVKYDNDLYAGKLLSFYVDGNLVGSAVTDASGEASIEFTAPHWPAGTRQLELRAAEDTIGLADSDTGNLTILKQTPELLIFDRTAQHGENVSHRISLRRPTNQDPIVGRTVTFKVNGVTTGDAVTDANGDATLNFAYFLVPNTYTFTGEFVGDADFNPTSDTGTLTITKAATNLSAPNAAGAIGGTAPLSATLRRTHDNGLIAGETVSFSIASVTVGSAVTNASGVATFSYTVPNGPLGNSALVANYAGSVNYLTSTRSATFVRTANTTLTVQPKSGERGQTITLTANLRQTHDNAVITGQSVNFFVNGTPVGSAATNASGNASLPFVIPTAFEPGTTTIGASFSNSAAFLNNSSGTADLTVNRWAVSLGVTNATGTAGQTVNFLSQLARNLDGSPVAGATINYSLAGVGIGSAVTNASGNASRSHTVLIAALGNKVLGVNYTGNANYLPASANGIFTQTGKTFGGQVNLQDWVGPVAGRQVTGQVFNSTGGFVESFSATVDASGHWERTNLIASTGTHTIKLKASHWLARDTVANVSVLGNNSINHSLINGDSDGDNEIGSGDLSIVSAAFLSAFGDPGYNPDADLDGDGEVGSSDLSILSANFLLTGD